MFKQDENALRFTIQAPDGENGFPGEFKVTVCYEFTDDNELKIHYSGVYDQDTVANLTNHSLSCSNSAEFSLPSLIIN